MAISRKQWKAFSYHLFILARITEDGTVTGVSACTAVMQNADGYKGVPDMRIQGWGQGLTLAFLADVLNVRNNPC